MRAVIRLPLSAWLQNLTCMLSLISSSCTFPALGQMQQSTCTCESWSEHRKQSIWKFSNTNCVNNVTLWCYDILWKSNQNLFLLQPLNKYDNRQMSHCRKCWSQSRALEQVNYFNYLEFVMKNSSSFQEICTSLAIAWLVMTVTAKYHVPSGFAKGKLRTGGLF